MMSAPRKLTRAGLAASLILLIALPATITARAADSEKPGNGVVLYSAIQDGNRALYSRQSNGTDLQRIPIEGLADHPVVSPHGRRLAFTKYGPWGAQVWVSYLDGAGLVRLTTGSSETMPAWSPTGGQVAFTSGRKGRRDIHRILSDGTGLRRVTSSRRNDEQPAWSVTNRIAFVRRSAESDDIYTISPSGRRGARPLTNDGADDRFPAWSPTGQTLVFSSGESGRRDLHLLTANGSKRRRLTRIPGDETEPTFSPDGTRIAFVHRREGKQHLYVVKVKGRPVTRLPRRSLRVRRLTPRSSASRAPSWQPTGFDPVVAAAGDIACDPSDPNFVGGGGGRRGFCEQQLTSNLLLRKDLAAVLVPGDVQYNFGALGAFHQSFDPTWGRVKELIRPVPGNHEYDTPGAAGYFDYFNGPGANTGAAGDRDKGYYSFDVGSWHLVALNSECGEIGGCGANSPQARWLREDLAGHSAACTAGLLALPQVHFRSLRTTGGRRHSALRLTVREERGCAAYRARALL